MTVDHDSVVLAAYWCLVEAIQSIFRHVLDGDIALATGTLEVVVIAESICALAAEELLALLP